MHAGSYTNCRAAKNKATAYTLYFNDTRQFRLFWVQNGVCHVIICDVITVTKSLCDEITSNPTNPGLGNDDLRHDRPILNRIKLGD